MQYCRHNLIRKKKEKFLLHKTQFYSSMPLSNQLSCHTALLARLFVVINPLLHHPKWQVLHILKNPQALNHHHPLPPYISLSYKGCTVLHIIKIQPPIIIPSSPHIHIHIHLHPHPHSPHLTKIQIRQAAQIPAHPRRQIITAAHPHLR